MCDLWLVIRNEAKLNLLRIMNYNILVLSGLLKSGQPRPEEIHILAQEQCITGRVRIRTLVCIFVQEYSIFNRLSLVVFQITVAGKIHSFSCAMQRSHGSTLQMLH